MEDESRMRVIELFRQEFSQVVPILRAYRERKLAELSDEERESETKAVLKLHDILNKFEKDWRGLSPADLGLQSEDQKFVEDFIAGREHFNASIQEDLQGDHDEY